VIKHSRDWNLTREAALSSGLHPRTPAYDVQRACGTSLTTVVQLARRIALGEIDCATRLRHLRNSRSLRCASALHLESLGIGGVLPRQAGPQCAPLGPIDRTKLNLKGGSVALGHPFGATGARIVATLAKRLAERGSGRGLISICTAGGMGVTAILER
jgi:acetyl-CoA acetyltransferase